MNKIGKIITKFLKPRIQQTSKMDLRAQTSIIFMIIIHCSRCQKRAGKISEICGSQSDNEALITYTGDVEGVLALTKNETVCWFAVRSDIGDSVYTLKAKYKPTGTEGECIMDKHKTKDSYSLEVQVRKQIKEVEMAGDEFYQVECSFDPVAHSRTKSFNIIEGLRMFLQDPRFSEPGFSLYFIDLDGEPIFEFARVGEHVRLLLVMADEDKKYGITVDKCDIRFGNSTKRKLFINGCGTGSSFPTDEGFILDGPAAIGPEFIVSKMKNYSEITIGCDVRKCLQPCGVSTCGEHDSQPRQEKRSLPKNDAGHESQNDDRINFHPIRVEATLSILDPVSDVEGTTLRDEPIQIDDPEREKEKKEMDKDKPEEHKASPYTIPLAIIAGILALLCLIAVSVGLFLVFRIKRNHQRQRQIIINS